MARFDEKLVLGQWMLKQFGVEKLEVLGKTLSEDHLIGFNEENNSRYLFELTSWIPESNRAVKNDRLRQYDDNIVKHWRQIVQKRNLSGNTLYPLYFQYLSLLFTEYYLERYFSDKSGLCVELNHFLVDVNKNLSERERILPFVESDLNKLAVWIATGGGKTLIMHVNILQFEYYSKKYGKSHIFNRTLLLTPNEGLSLQHKNELDASNLSSDLFTKGGGDLLTQSSVQIIDIHKLQMADKVGKSSDGRSVAVESFESNNLVLVDEGHRGASGKEWMAKRNLLCEDGFSFEYSATFGQAIKAASGSDLAPAGSGAPSSKYQLVQQYAKCILFDYSYKFFHSDGYGKDHFILNLAEAWSEEQVQLYLTGSILRFYQQKCLFKDKAKSIADYLLADPLWIFVGGKVTAKNEANADTVSDIQAIIQFIARFVANTGGETIGFIEQFLTQQDDLRDSGSRLIFANAFPYLHKRWKTDQAATVFTDVLKQVFNAEVPANLHIVHLKGGVNEIGLRIGGSDDNWFGVINVGESAKLHNMCEEAIALGKLPNCVATDQSFSQSLFEGINKKGSTVNLLIGAKKFTEGWSSWRVCSMGLMNVGRSEGSEIIQLFGRGVRLRGYDFSLKRSSHLPGIKHPEFVEQLETLNVFGIRSNYMKEFEEYLEAEGVGEKQVEVITLPVIKRLKRLDLKLIKVDDTVVPFKRAVKPWLEVPPEEMYGRISLNWYPKIQTLKNASSVSQVNIDLNEGFLQPKHLAFINTEAIYFELAQYKNEKAWYNLQLSKEQIEKLLSDPSWYRLLIPAELLEVKDFERVRLWQEIAISLIKKYAERFYKFKQQEYEGPHLKYVELDPSDKNFVSEYKASIDISQQEWIDKITELKDKLENGKFSDEWKFGNFLAMDFSRHQYQPLIHFKNNDVMKISPVPLNQGESDFITDLKNHYLENTSFYENKELYILRNQSKGKGVGFFEAGNFYPDFIMWVIVDGVQYVSFIDPKGLRFINGFDDPKVTFCQKIKEIESRIDDPNVVLNSFLISNTLQTDLFWWKSGSDLDKAFANHHILFQTDENYIDVLYESILDAKFIQPISVSSSVSSEKKLLGKLKVVVETNGTLFEADAKLLARSLEDIINDAYASDKSDAEAIFKVEEIKPGSIELVGSILSLVTDGYDSVIMTTLALERLNAYLKIGTKVKSSLKNIMGIYPFIKRTVKGRDSIRELRLMTDEELEASLKDSQPDRSKDLHK